MHHTSVMFCFQAEACRSVAMAMKKCPHGMFAEIKYDGERVQVHKQGNTFQYFSRSLKPVQEHKVRDQIALHFVKNLKFSKFIHVQSSFEFLSQHNNLFSH